MKGIILINGFSGIGEHQASRLQEEFAGFGYDIPIVKNRLGEVPSDVDFCIFLDKDLYTAKTLEESGVKIYNSSSAISLCDDKMLTYIALKGVAEQPYTIPSTFCYTTAEVEEGELDYVEEKLGYPLVVKINKQSRGEGVFLVTNRKELAEIISKLRTIPHLYQKFISYASGRDTRVIVVGNKVLCAMERYNEKDFRSNVEQGGVCRNVEVDERIRNIAIKVSKTLGLEYCGIDFVFDEDGKAYVVEVNSNAFFKGIEGASKVNVARAYVERVLELNSTKF